MISVHPIAQIYSMILTSHSDVYSWLNNNFTIIKIFFWVFPYALFWYFVFTWSTKVSDYFSLSYCHVIYSFALHKCGSDPQTQLLNMPLNSTSFCAFLFLSLFSFSLFCLFFLVYSKCVFCIYQSDMKICTQFNSVSRHK